MKDFGYDISDYRDVDPMFGTLEDFKALLAKAHALGLKVMIDQVISHSSDSTPGSRRAAPIAPMPRPTGTSGPTPGPTARHPTTGCRSSAGRPGPSSHGVASTTCTLPDQDLNFLTRGRAGAAGQHALRLELGVDGFPLDTVNTAYDAATDNPPVPAGSPKTLGAPEANPYTWQRHVHDISRPENLDFLRELRALMDEFPGTTTVGEIGDDNPLERMAEYTAGGDKLHMAYTFDLLNAPHSPAYLREVIERFQRLAGDAWPCWATSNHDVERSATRWGRGEDPVAYPKVMLAMLFSLRGSVCLYQGEELGLPEAEVPFERIQDPYGKVLWPEFKGRDGCRTPMPYTRPRRAASRPWSPGCRWAPPAAGRRSAAGRPGSPLAARAAGLPRRASGADRRRLPRRRRRGAARLRARKRPGAPAVPQPRRQDPEHDAAPRRHPAPGARLRVTPMATP